MPPFDGSHYVLKRQLLKFIGRGFGIYDPAGNQILQADETPLQWREELRLYGGLGMRQELIGIFARSYVNFAATYDIVDMTNGHKIGAFGRRWLHSMVRDEWTFLDHMDRQIGVVIEDSLGLALLRRTVAGLVPQNYDLVVGNQKVIDFRQNFNPFTYHLNIHFLTPPAHFDRRLGIAAAVLLGTVEGRQQEHHQLINPLNDMF